MFPDDDPPPLWAKAASIEGKGDSWNRWVYTPPASIMFDVGAAQAGTGAFDGNLEHAISIHNAHGITPETEMSWELIAVSIITMLIVYFINPILGSEANFWYLASKPDSLTVINFFPDPPYHIIGMFILGLLIIILAIFSPL